MHFFRILTQYLKLAIANIENSSYVCMKDSLLLNTKGLIYSGPSSGGALKIRTKCNVFAYCTTICPFLGQKPMIFNNTILVYFEKKIKVSLIEYCAHSL